MADSTNADLASSGKSIYLDNSAATRVDERVLEAMKPYLFDTYAVATSDFAYSMGIEAKEGLEQARQSLADKIGAGADEIVFTADSTESSNLAIRGVIKAVGKTKDKHVITSKIEDFPVLNTCKDLEKDGWEVTNVEVDKYGNIDIDQLESAIRDNTAIVSLQHANQEIGTIQDIASIGQLCRDKGVIFHTDATHTFMRVPIDVSKDPIDLMTFSAHTIHGQRGIAALYVREGVPIKKIMAGGYQEKNIRPGFENIAGAVGFARAAELITEEENDSIRGMRDYLIDTLLSTVPDTILNGERQKRTAQNANISFSFIEGESMTLHLDFRGIAVSTGSACFSKSLEASHVMFAIGGDHERAHGSIRFSMSRFNTMDEIKAVAVYVADIVKNLRAISPLGKS